jgi:hypothetical protein
MTTDLLSSADVQSELAALSGQIQNLVDEKPTELVDLMFDLSRLRIVDSELTKTNKSPGSPQKINSDLIKKVIGLVLSGCSKQGAANSAGIATGTHNGWLGEAARLSREVLADPDCQTPLTDWERLVLVYRESLQQAALMCEGQLIRSINRSSEDDWRAAAFILARRFPKRWGSHRERGEAATGGPNVNVNVSGVLAVAPVAVSVDAWQDAARIPAPVIDVDAVPLLTEQQTVKRPVVEAREDED